MALLRPALVLVSAVLVILAGCGKRGGFGSVGGTYYLATDATPTTLTVYANGTYTVRRELCDDSPPSSASGSWRLRDVGSVVLGPSDYWPTPDEFPSVRLDALTVEQRGRDDIQVVGKNAWFGSFEQRWTRSPIETIGCE